MSHPIESAVRAARSALNRAQVPEVTASAVAQRAAVYLGRKGIVVDGPMVTLDDLRREAASQLRRAYG